MSKPVFTLFLTEGMSLKEWDRLGLLPREMAIYEHLMKDYSVQVFSYGNVGDLYYEQCFPDLKVLIIPYYEKHATWKNKWHLLKAKLRLRRSLFFKTNQIKGADKAVYYAKKWGIPLITRCGYLWSTFTKRQTEHHQEIHRVLTLERDAFQSARFSFVSSDRDRDYVMDTHNISPDAIFTVPNYVDQSVFSPVYENRESGHILYIGRLSEQKNLFSFLDAFEKSALAQKLTMIGLGEHESALKEKASLISKPVTFLGALPNSALPEFLQKASVYVLPSFYEGLPKTLLEAMSCGIACLGTNVEGIREVIQHQENGFLCDTDVDSLAVALDNLLSDDELRLRLGKRAFTTIQEKYSLNSVVALEKSVYARI
jgi:glycosyltransferase involved in cell wall biosynthesis